MPALDGPGLKKSSALNKQGVELKQHVKVETAAGNWSTVDGNRDPNKRSAPYFEPHRATENKRSDARLAEKSDQKRNASSSSRTEGANRPTNGKPTDAQSSGANANDREGWENREKRHVSTDKNSVGVTKKMEVTKGEEGAAVLKAKYGKETDAQSSGTNANDREGRENREKQRASTDKHSVGMTEKIEATKSEAGSPAPTAKYGPMDPVAAETEKEVQKPSVVKENLGSLVKTASFLLKNGRQEARIALHPDALGHLKIRISMEQQHVTVRVMAETSAAKELIEHNLHQLKADFQQQGLEISKFDVTLSQDSNSGNSSGAGQNSFFSSNRAKGKSFRKQQSPQENGPSEQTVVTSARGHNRDAVDFFA